MIKFHVRQYSPRDISWFKNRLALLYIFCASFPAFYIAPFIIMMMFIIGLMELINGRSPATTKRIGYCTLILFIFLIFSALISGVSILDLFSYQSIRYDANIFFSLLPILILGTGCINIKTLDFCIVLSAVIGSLLYLILPIFDVYTFESKNAAGGYFMVLLAYLTGRGLTTGWSGRRISILLLSVAIIASDSRGSILALIGAVCYLWMFINYKRFAIIFLIFSFIGFGIGLAVSYSWWLDNNSIYLYDYAEFGSATEQLTLDQFFIGERPGTVLHRALYLYPMAVDMFLKSPFIGLGFTRFNDFPLEVHGWNGLVALNFSGEVIFSNLHAHNSYLHFAAEIGIVGIWLVYRIIRAQFQSFVNSSDYLYVVGIIVGSLLIASLTEHRLTTPSQATPAFVIICLIWISIKYKAVTSKSATKMNSVMGG